MATSHSGAARRLARGGFWLGFALGGFFDGIVLHQVLQWHHLLSGVAPGGTVPDLRFQIVADGLFHVAHYLFAALGLWLLWHGRTAAGAPGADRRLAALALLGFGAWHAVDAVLSHWLLGLHRIRMDTALPLLWDLLWLVPFGLLPLAAGAWILRRPGTGRGRASLAGLVLAVLAGAPAAALPPRGNDGLALVVFRPGMELGAIVAAVDQVRGRLVWSDAAGGVWLVATGTNPARLYRHGALMVSGGNVGLGCIEWTKVRESFFSEEKEAKGLSSI
jgi:uncharacterized membrane protein